MPESTPAPNTRYSPIDTDALLRRCMGNARVVAMILERFEREAGEDFAALAEGVRAARFAEASALAHRLKGAAAMMAASGLANAIGSIEAAATTAVATQTETALREAKAELESCLAFLPAARTIVGCAAPSPTGPNLV
jgi:HPt (histidine-containing phosphotransfer) domain-containing protein